jgi:hypothetical protein
MVNKLKFFIKPRHRTSITMKDIVKGYIMKYFFKIAQTFLKNILKIWSYLTLTKVKLAKFLKIFFINMGN